MPAKIEGPLYRDVYTLHIWRRVGNYIEIAMSDGSWISLPEMVAVPENSGILIPGDVFKDVFQAFLEYSGFKSHDATEVKVLREWLITERNRVEDLVQQTIKLMQ